MQRNHEVSYLDDTTVQLNGGLLHANPTHDSSNAHHNRVNGFVGPNVARQAVCLSFHNTTVMRRNYYLFISRAELYVRRLLAQWQRGPRTRTPF